MSAAKSARSVAAAEEALAGARTRHADAEAALAAATTRESEAAAAAEAARDTSQQESARAEERDTARRETQRLEALLPRLDRLAELERQAETAKADLRAAEAAHATGAERLETARTTLARAETDLRAAEQAEARLAGARRESESLARAADKRGRLATLTREVDEAETGIAELDAAAEAAASARASAERAFEDAVDGLGHHQAARLARTLEAGTPCPVCGSPAHPDPATPDGDRDALADLEGARADLQAAQQHEREALQARDTARAAQDRRRHKRDALAADLGDQAELDADTLRAHAREAAETVTRLEAAAARVGTARAGHAEASSETAAAEAALDRLAADWRAAAGAEAAAASALEAARVELPEDLRTRAALEARITAARQRQHDLETAFERTRVDKESAEQAETAAAEARRAAAAQAEKAAGDAETARAAFTRALADAGFDDESAYAAAKADHAGLDALQAEIDDHRRRREAAAARVRQIDTETAGAERPDLAALEAAAQTAREALDAAQAEATRLEERLAVDRKRITRLEDIEQKLAATQASLRRVAEMARVARGENPLRLSFERYVMTELLDEILAAATARLSVMSRGRYALMRDRTPGDQRRHSGLDIVVLDDHSGKLRPASTLSGGEGFLASLALALGTSDVVQARSGGVRLDALYIDEGFGSLDSETLDQAMRVIIDLQRRSDRVIGMISHVAEMRERVPTRLDVQAGRAGSAVSVRLP